MSGLRHIRTEVSIRDEYLRSVNANRRLAGGDYTDRDEDRKKDEELAAKLSEENFVEMAKEEEFILTITADGMGKRTSCLRLSCFKTWGQGD